MATGVPTAPTGTTVPLCPLGLGADILSRLRSHVGASEPGAGKAAGVQGSETPRSDSQQRAHVITRQAGRGARGAGRGARGATCRRSLIWTLAACIGCAPVVVT